MQHKYDLAGHRINMAHECLTAAKNNLASKDYKASANRSYYCIFNAMRSITALDGRDFKSHKALITHFRANYIKTGIFEKELSTTLRDLLQARTASDYDDFYIIGKEDVIQQIEKAEQFLNCIEKYVKQHTPTT